MEHGTAGARSSAGRVADDPDAALRALLAEHGGEPHDGGAAFDHGLAALASDLVLKRGVALSARDVAGRTGDHVAVVVRLFHNLGVAVADLDVPMFTTADAVLIERLARAGDLGLAEGDELLRVVAGAMERIAEAAVAVYVQGPEEELRRRLASPAECARANMQATELALDIGVGLAPVFRHHMRQTVARQRVIQEGVSRRELARLAIGFVDLVGSTALQSGLDPRALAGQVSRFESRAFDVILGRGGRLVKFIGDEIMFAAVEPAAGVGIVADLVAAFRHDGTEPRGGLVFGEVLFRHGDYYGPMVNLAARLVDAAIPGETLVDGSVVAALGGDGATFEPAGRRMLKGFDEPVPVWSLGAAF